MLAKTFVRQIYLIVGTVFLITGIIGIFLPLLPTTPFLLLTAFCYNRGSEKFHSWLINHTHLGPPIRDWQQRHVIRKKHKALAVSMMTVSLVFVLYKDTIPSVGKISLAVFLIAMSTFILTRKSQ